jgi:hypothetical protein
MGHLKLAARKSLDLVVDISFAFCSVLSICYIVSDV